MKFVVIAAIVALVKAEVGADCSVDTSVCEVDVECCGTGSPYVGDDFIESVTVCQKSTETTYESADDATLKYQFACNSSEEAATKNVAIASVATILAAAAYSACSI